MICFPSLGRFLLKRVSPSIFLTKWVSYKRNIVIQRGTTLEERSQWEAKVKEHSLHFLWLAIKGPSQQLFSLSLMWKELQLS